MKNLKKYYILKADPKDVYNALTNKKVLEIWTGEEVVFEPVPGTEFSLWSGSITGINLEFETDKKIVQKWFFGEEFEDSTVTILLHYHKRGTSVELHHSNIPEEAFKNISEGWDEDYFGALKDLFD